MDLPRPLVDAGWLGEHLGSAHLVVADVRWVPGGSAADVAAAFEAGHVPGAVLLDVDRDLAGPAGRRGRHPLPAPAAFAEAMSRCGVDDRASVVAVDDAGGSLAARLWWMLDALGLPVAVLDGGTGTWSGPLERGPSSPARATFTPRPWPSGSIVDADELAGLLRRREAVLFDTRVGERYRGEVEPIDAVAGHVPGALSAPWADNLDPATGRFRPPSELRERYAAATTHADRAVTMCGSGVTACHALLAMRVAGLGRARLFPGSWSGWIAEGSRPVAVGPEPGEPA
jgi:thiosulfate/3-mercaptopyruvate sulfurtransferase